MGPQEQALKAKYSALRFDFRSKQGPPDAGIDLRAPKPGFAPQTRRVPISAKPEPALPVPITVICLCPKCGERSTYRPRPKEPDPEPVKPVRWPLIREIIDIVAKGEKVSSTDIVSARRHWDVVRPRQLVCFLAKNLTPHSYPYIGKRLGNRDHTTIIHGVRSVERRRYTDPVLDAKIKHYEKMLKEITDGTNG